MAEQVIIEFVADTTKFEEAYNRVNAAVEESSTLNKQSADSFKQANTGVQASLSGVTGEAKKMSDQFRNMGETIAGGIFKTLIEDAAKLSGQIKTVTATINANKDAMVKLAQAGKESSAEFKKLRDDTGQLTQQMARVQEAVKNAAMEFKGLRAGQDALQGLTGGFEAAQAASELLGSKNEELEKSLTVLTTVSKGLNGVMEVANVLKKESAAVALIEKGQELALAAAIELETAAQSENIIVSKSAAVAQAALNAVMDANPVMLLVGAIAAVAAGLVYFTKTTGEATEAQKRFNDTQKETIENLKTSLDIERNASDSRIKFAEQNIEDLKAQRASAEDIRKAEAVLDQERVTAADNQVNLLGKRVSNFNKYKAQYIQAQKDLNNQIAALEKEQDAQKHDGKLHPVSRDFDKEIEQAKTSLKNLTGEMNVVQGAINQQSKAYSDQFNNRLKREKQAQAEADQQAIVRIKLAVANAQAGSKAELEAKLAQIKAETDAETDEVKNSVATKQYKQLKIALIRKQANQQGAELTQAYRVKSLENAAADFDAQNLQIQKGTKAELDAQIESINLHATAEHEKVKDSATAADEHQRIDDKADADTAAATKAFNDKQRADDYEAQITMAQVRLMVAQKGSKNELAAKKDVIKAEYDLQINNISTTIQNENLKSAEVLKANTELKQKLQDADSDFLNKQVAAHSEHSDKITDLAQAQKGAVDANPQSTANEKVAASQAVLKAEHDAMVQQMKDNNDLHDQKMKNLGDDEKAQAEENQNYELTQKTLAANITTNALAQKKLVTDQQKEAREKQEANEKAIAQESIKLAQQTSSQIFEMEQKNRDEAYAATISRLEKEAQFQLSSSNLTAAQRVAIEKGLQKKEAQLKLQQWEADKQSKLEQAEINGALAIVNILATMPWSTFGVTQAIAIAGAIASTAVQVATIAAQKPPQFAKGTPRGHADAPEGMILVGEKGPELMYNKSPARVITADDTAKILSNYEIPSFSTPMPSVSNDALMHVKESVTHTAMNEDSLAKKIAREMGKIPKTNISIDKHGLQVHLLQSKNRITILNKSFNRQE